MRREPKPPAPRQHSRLLAASALVLSVAWGCSSVFDIEASEYRGSGPADGGDGLAGGEPAQGASGGSSRAGHDAGGTGGSPTLNDAGAGQGGAALVPGGAGGEAGDVEPEVDAPCFVPGALVCAGPFSRLRLLCEGGVWQRNSCGAAEACDRSSGACGAVFSSCRPDRVVSWCDLGSAVRCGPDGVTLERETCRFGCYEGACNPPRNGELIVDEPPAVRSENVPWPLGVVPVCVEDASDPEWGWVQDEVERTWGRHSGVSFRGFQSCAEPSAEFAELARVEAVLADDCAGELMSVSQYGYPGPGARVSLRLCRESTNADGDRRTADEALLRFIARHAFGHVLGRGHDSSQTDLMSEVLYDPMLLPRFETPQIEWVQRLYGRKPSGSLVSTGGRCVDLDAAQPAAATCDGSPAQRVVAVDGQLQHDGACLRASEGGLEVAACPDAPAEAFAFRTDAVQWRGWGGECISVWPAGSARVPHLSLEPCRELGDPAQTWAVEFGEDGAVQIRQASDGLCVSVPLTSPPGFPRLTACTDAAQVLRATSDGQLRFGGHCLLQDWSLGVEPLIRFAPCAGDIAQRFYISGPFQQAGAALTLFDGELTVSALEPSPEQIFDYYF